jgi:hypothetical protein
MPWRRRYRGGSQAGVTRMQMEPVKKKILRPRWLWLALLGIILFHHWPVAYRASVGPGGHRTDACPVFGIDIKDFLYFLAVFRWFLLFTVPVGALAFIAWLTIALGLLARRAFLLGGPDIYG